MKKYLLALLMSGPAFAFAVNGTVTVIDKIAPQNGAFVGVVDSSQTVVSTSTFSKNLGATDTDVQHALQTLDQLTTSGGTGTPGGSVTQLQINGGGVFIGTAALTMNTTTNFLTVGATTQFSNVSNTSWTNFSTVTMTDMQFFLNNTLTTNTTTMMIVSTGTGQALKVIGQGIPAGGLQGANGGIVNIERRNLSDGLVIYSSVTSAQAGSTMLHIMNDAPGYNDPLIWVHNVGNTSNPFMRVDDQAPDMELVNTSTANSVGLGKWEPMAIAYQGVDLQVNSRAYSNGTFENVAYWSPLQNGGGLTLSAVINGQDSNPSPSDSQYIQFFTTNSHTVGIKGPKSSTASWNFILPATFANGGQVMYQTADNPRQWAFTTGGVAGQVLSFNGTSSAPTWITASSGGGGYALEPATVTILAAVGEKVSTMTITSLSPGVMHIVIGSSNVVTGLVSPSTEIASGVLPNTVQVSSVGAQILVSSFPATAVTAGSYTNTNVTVNAQGIITAASNGSAGSGGSTIYNATATAGFPFGFSASTGNFTSSVTANALVLPQTISTIPSIFANASKNTGIVINNAPRGVSIVDNGTDVLDISNPISTYVELDVNKTFINDFAYQQVLAISGTPDSSASDLSFPHTLINLSHTRSTGLYNQAYFGLRDAPGEDQKFVVIGSSVGPLGYGPYPIGSIFSLNVTTSSANYGNLGLGISTATAKLHIISSTTVPAMIANGQYSSLEATTTFASQISTVNWNNGNVQYLVLTGTTTLSFSNPISGGRYLLVLRQDATGSRTVTWPGSVHFSNGATPTLTTTAAKEDVVTFFYDGNNAIYLAGYTLNY